MGVAAQLASQGDHPLHTPMLRAYALRAKFIDEVYRRSRNRFSYFCMAPGLPAGFEQKDSRSAGY
jgi:hypothetical protein